MRASSRASLALVLLVLATGRTAEAQVPRPPDRANGNDHKTSADQDELVADFAQAWALCLSPHLGRHDLADIRGALEGRLQNQYSDHAAHDFWRDVAELVYEDLGLSGPIGTEDKKRCMQPGGLLVPLVDAVLAKAVATSEGVLCFDDSSGGSAFQAQHALLMLEDPACVEAVRSVIRRREPSKEQAAGALELARHYSACLRANLPLSRSAVTKFDAMVRELASRPNTDDAVQGIYTKLRFAVRNHVQEGKTCKSIQDFLRLDQEIDAYLVNRIPRGFWAKLGGHHEEMMAAPEAYRKLFKKERCELAAAAPPAADDGDR